MVAVTLLFGVFASSAQTGVYLYSGSKQTITLGPGLYDITAYGAQGGDYTAINGHGITVILGGGGLGAEIEGQFDFTNVTILTLQVGGAGQVGNTYSGAGGGGGSFVVDGTTPLVIAGGGGGTADVYALYGPIGGAGLTGVSGGNGGAGSDGGGGSGGSGGNGGSGDASGGGGGGGGYSGGGGNGGHGGSGGKSYLNGGAGGLGYTSNDGPAGQGGYGGGGGGYGGGGGGGGYSGGGGGGQLSGGGGGGSYVDTSAIADLTEASGVASPDGFPNGEVTITAVQPSLCISESGNIVSVYWPAVPGWSLQQNTNLANPSGWTASSGVTALNGTNYLNLTSPSGNMFFRLMQ